MKMNSSFVKRLCTKRYLVTLVATFLIVTLAVPAVAQNRDTMVFAAASLKDALDDANVQYQKETGKKAIISYAASSALAKQIESAAPADIFISADLDWMDYLAKKNLIKAETRKNLLGNKLVLVAPKDSNIKVKIEPNFQLAKLLAGGKLAMANVASVPAGKYGKASLEKLNVWASVQSGVAQADNVRAALALVARKEAPLGIVYQTDAVAEPGVKIVGIFPEDTHPPIIYPIAILANSTNPDAVTFVKFLESPKGRPAFEKQGFAILK